MTSKSLRNVILCTGFGLLFSLNHAYLNIEQYCQAFDSNFRPIICILKNNTATAAPHRPRPQPHPQPPPIYPILYPDYEDRPSPPNHHHPDFETEDDDCSCDTDCYPVIANQAQNMTGISYNCRSCGTSCSVRGSTARCNCATPNGNATCVCTTTCASFRHYSHYEHVDDDDDDDDSSEGSNCIFNVNITDTRISQELRPYNCECCRSKAAEVTSEPDFVCICQRISAKNHVRIFEDAVIVENKKV